MSGQSYGWSMAPSQPPTSSWRHPSRWAMATSQPSTCSWRHPAGPQTCHCGLITWLPVSGEPRTSAIPHSKPLPLLLTEAPFAWLCLCAAELRGLVLLDVALPKAWGARGAAAVWATPVGAAQPQRLCGDPGQVRSQVTSGVGHMVIPLSCTGTCKSGQSRCGHLQLTT